MTFTSRLVSASRAAGIHFGLSLAVAAFCAALVFGLWYPGPFKEMAGGQELFLLVVAVDVVCGPLLTLVLYNPTKPRAELWRDLGLVALIQGAALAYGLLTVWQARPLFLAHEIDRFKVISLTSVAEGGLDKLSSQLKPAWYSGPQIVGLRELSVQERQTVMLESVEGGYDYGERPEYYVPYDDSAANRAIKRARPLESFLATHPNERAKAAKAAARLRVDTDSLKYVPVIGRADWVALVDARGYVIDYLRGDGF